MSRNYPSIQGYTRRWGLCLLPDAAAAGGHPRTDRTAQRTASARERLSCAASYLARRAPPVRAAHRLAILKASTGISWVGFEPVTIRQNIGRSLPGHSVVPQERLRLAQGGRRASQLGVDGHQIGALTQFATTALGSTNRGGAVMYARMECQSRAARSPKQAWRGRSVYCVVLRRL